MGNLAGGILLVTGLLIGLMLVGSFPTTSFAQKKVSEYEQITKKVLSLMRELAGELRKIKSPETLEEAKRIVPRIDAELVAQIKKAEELVKEKGMPALKEKVLLEARYQASIVQADIELRDAIRRARSYPGGEKVVNKLTAFQRSKKNDKKKDKNKDSR
ncbi:MAG: hypothetical protein ACFCD0_29670 [Gemmataceae bacterium]